MSETDSDKIIIIIKITITRKNSSRMRIARLSTYVLHNEEVWTYQEGGWSRTESLYKWKRGEWGCGEGPCMVSSNASWILVTYDRFPLNKITDTTENISFPQLRWQAITIIDVTITGYMTKLSTYYKKWQTIYVIEMGKWPSLQNKWKGWFSKA